MAGGSFGGGNGTPGTPFLIEDVADLNAIRNYYDTSFKLVNNINLSGVPWTPIVYLEDSDWVGILDGDNFKITNLTINDETMQGAGLFKKVGAAQLLNIHMENVNIISYGNSGGLTGRAVNSVISNCTLKNGTIKDFSDEPWNLYIGGLIGEVEYMCHLENCSTENLIVEGRKSTGGFAGRILTWNTIINCYSKNCEIKGKGVLGGFSGRIVTSIVDTCYSENDITDTGTESNIFDATCGGFVGRLTESNVTDCYSKGNVSGFLMVGGFVGNSMQNEISNSHAECNVSGLGMVGGFCGMEMGTTGGGL